MFRLYCQVFIFVREVCGISLHFEGAVEPLNRVYLQHSQSLFFERESFGGGGESQCLSPLHVRMSNPDLCSVLLYAILKSSVS